VPQVMVVLLDVVFEAFSRQRPLSKLNDERVLDVGLPQPQVRLDEVCHERMWVRGRGSEKASMSGRAALGTWHVTYDGSGRGAVKTA
jgi:hypothetical protein